MLNDEGSVKGKGPSIMIPPRGSPFAAAPAPGEAIPAGGETAAPLAALEPRDLSPEDLMGMPSAEGAAADAQTPFAAPEMPEAEGPSLRADADLPAHDVEPDAGETSALEAASRADLDLPAHDAVAASAEEQAALEPSSHADRLGGEEAAGEGGIPPGAQPLAGVAAAMAVPATTASGGQALPGLRAFAGANLQIAESEGLTPEAFKPGAALAGKTDLVNMFIPDGRLVTVWTEIDAVEGRVASADRISLKVAREMLDRLAVARNYLMNDRANFEEAERQVAEVKYRLARLETSHALQQPLPIFIYLLIFIVLIVLAALWTQPITSAGLMKLLGEALKLDMVAVWATILWGGIGGVTGALYGLWDHVARDRDYDPEYAIWYYTNPLMGLILGLFVFIVAQVGLSEVTKGSTFILYFLAWAVGFRQNLAFSLANTILKRLTPEEKPDEVDKAGHAPHAVGGAGAPPSDTTTFPAPKK
jgi:hypothetical protein